MPFAGAVLMVSRLNPSLDPAVHEELRATAERVALGPRGHSTLLVRGVRRGSRLARGKGGRLQARRSPAPRPVPCPQACLSSVFSRLFSQETQTSSRRAPHHLWHLRPVVGRGQGVGSGPQTLLQNHGAVAGLATGPHSEMSSASEMRFSARCTNHWTPVLSAVLTLHGGHRVSRAPAAAFFALCWEKGGVVMSLSSVQAEGPFLQFRAGQDSRADTPEQGRGAARATDKAPRSEHSLGNT